MVVEPFKIENESEAEAYLNDFLAKPEYRSPSEVIRRAKNYVPNKQLRNYFVKKGIEILKRGGRISATDESAIAGLVTSGKIEAHVEPCKDWLIRQSELTEMAVQTQQIFIVHGHDAEAKAEVARFIEKLGFKPIILHEQASRGRTIIEKVESHSNVGFAVVLLTPDDEGNKKGESPRPRARQNVVLELGYFVGRLGRDRVCALRRGNVEIPSDFDGVVYETYDDHGAWKSKLAKELEAARFIVDWAKVHA